MTYNIRIIECDINKEDMEIQHDRTATFLPNIRQYSLNFLLWKNGYTMILGNDKCLP